MHQPTLPETWDAKFLLKLCSGTASFKGSTLSRVKAYTSGTDGFTPASHPVAVEVLVNYAPAYRPFEDAIDIDVIGSGYYVTCDRYAPVGFLNMRDRDGRHAQVQVWTPPTARGRAWDRLVVKF